jgi:hypothetical protein
VLPASATSDGIYLYWIPLGAGAGGALVRWSGRAYETVVAFVGRRRRRPLFHSALEIRVDGTTTVVEMAPVWTKRGERGVVSEGPVGFRSLGRSRLFRYEVRCWEGGSIPDAAAAIGGPLELTGDRDVARRTLELVPRFPSLVWGRDELSTGDMWNSNSLVSWLLANAGLDLTEVEPPDGGRAPGWRAGLAASSSRRPAMMQAFGQPVLDSAGRPHSSDNFRNP